MSIMPKFLVIYPQPFSPLLLKNVKINDKDEISGYVVNGAWNYEEHDGMLHAYGPQRRLMNSVPLIDRYSVIVETDKFGIQNYNDIIFHAYEIPTKATVDDIRTFVKDQSMIKERHNEEEFYDDDIPF